MYIALWPFSLELNFWAPALTSLQPGNAFSRSSRQPDISIDTISRLYQQLGAIYRHIARSSLQTGIFIGTFFTFSTVLSSFYHSRGTYSVTCEFWSDDDPPKCLKGIPSSNTKHVGSLKFGGVGVRGIIRKPEHFVWLTFGMNIKKISRGYFEHIFARVMLSYDTQHEIQLLQWLLPC